MIISAVGAGGKTTLLLKTAERLSVCGEKAAVTTTTKIWKPGLPEIRRWEKEGARVHVFGTPVDGGKRSVSSGGGKLSAPSEAEFGVIFRHYRHVLIEADGSKGLPLKIPADREPVIRKETELVVCVAGISALDRPLREVCFRWELLEGKMAGSLEGKAHGTPAGNLPGYRGITGEEPVTEEMVADILGSEWGGRKGVGSIPYRVFLNQCDTPQTAERAGRILRILKERYGVEGTCGVRGVPCSGNAAPWPVTI